MTWLFNQVSLTSMALLADDECNLQLQLEITQLLIQWNCFAIADQIQALYVIWCELQDFLQHLPPGVSAIYIHSLLFLWAINDAHREALWIWQNWLLNLENGAGGIFQRFIVVFKHSVRKVSVTWPGFKRWSTKPIVSNLKVNQDIYEQQNITKFNVVQSNQNTMTNVR